MNGIFTPKRDLCWLEKVITNKYRQFSVEDFDEPDAGLIHRTLADEMRLLFDNSSEVTEGAALVFCHSKVELGDGFCIRNGKDQTVIEASRESGYLYGMFRLYRFLAAGEEVPKEYLSKPDQSIRMVNHWDNFDGSIERGYAGDSIFYDQNHFRSDMGIIREYARLLASCGINHISINNVNVHRLEAFFIQDPALVEIRKICDVFAAYGIRTFLSLNFAAPIIVGKLSSADPCDESVKNWWKQIIRRIYEVIPNFAGFVIKADSEGEPGPFAYGRTHADGANMFAEALEPYGGIVIWRCFVYNCKQDWRDRSLDRAKAAYDLFIGLDGQFRDNVILQIKNGPIDFQIREPASPLFGALRHTNQILEFQITQEYTGHQIDVCYLPPMWKEVLNFDTKYEGVSEIAEILKEYSPAAGNSGIAAVVNVGMDHNWTGNKLAQANLFAYGLMCWDNHLSSEDMADQWVKLTFDLDEDKQALLGMILNTSRETYENYTCPLSVGFMCKPHLHYGVDIDGYEYDCWGTYHYADRNGVGRERSVADGTGFTAEYAKPRFEEYESLETCPDELLLFLHHVPYDHLLHSGKTVIQHIYDTHFAGVAKVEEYLNSIELLKGAIPERDYDNIKERMQRQLANAINWRDQVNTYFYRKSGIEDEAHRAVYQ